MQWFYIEIVCKIVLGSKINYQNYQSLIFKSRHLLIILTLKDYWFFVLRFAGNLHKNEPNIEKGKKR